MSSFRKKDNKYILSHDNESLDNKDELLDNKDELLDNKDELFNDDDVDKLLNKDELLNERFLFMMDFCTRDKK